MTMRLSHSVSARYGRKRSIETLFEGLFSAATYMDPGRLPELFCGFKRQRGYGSTLYPVAYLPQTWAGNDAFRCSQKLRLA